MVLASGGRLFGGEELGFDLVFDLSHEHFYLDIRLLFLGVIRVGPSASFHVLHALVDHFVDL